MARVLVTGAAGFIGGRLCEVLLDAGHEVLGIDRSPAVEGRLPGRDGYTGFIRDLSDDDVSDLVGRVDVVAHHAGRAGVRQSWGEHFDGYLRDNVTATQRLLEACRDRPLRRVIVASSSSVYGDASAYPTRESAQAAPVSPYGVTKLAAERLAVAYARSYRVPVTCLRYFTVFGPAQRPDMAFSRLIDSALGGTPFPLYGSGQQVRDFTYVDDVAAANLAMLDAAVEPGSVFNVAGGVTSNLLDAIAVVEGLVGNPVPIERLPAAHGDAWRTGGDTSALRRATGWRPRVSLHDGLAAQLAAHPGVEPQRGTRG